MIRLPEGTPKYLLIHPAQVERNSERAKVGDPIVVVVETSADKPSQRWLHRGYSVLTEGAASIAYSQRDPLFKVRFAPNEEDTPIYAAYYTTSAVLLAESPDEVLAFAEAESTTEESTAETPPADTKKGKKA